MSLKIISLNIEGKRHLDQVVPFLKSESADVVCLQEVFEDDLPKLKGTIYPHHLYLPTWRASQSWDTTIKASYAPGNQLFGIAMLSRQPITEVIMTRLDPDLPQIPENTGPGTWNPGLIVAKTGDFTIANTHFTWTLDSKADDRQRLHLQKIFELLKPYPWLVFVGDFNAPRGEEIHSALAKKFIDRTPKDIATTLDPKLHYANRNEPGKIKLVVDHIFTTPGYTAQVELKNNLSDHLALIARVDKSVE